MNNIKGSNKLENNNDLIKAKESRKSLRECFIKPRKHIDVHHYHIFSID